MSSSSPSSPNSSQDGNDNGNGNGIGGGSSSARRGGDFGPSTSRPRVNEVGPSTSRPRVNEVWPWPEHFVEALAAQVAIDASNSIGRLAAYPALLNVFLVCSTWLAVSRWDALWQRLTRRIWGRTHLLHLHATWRDEFIYWHRTAQNFRSGRSTHATLHFDDVDDPDGHTCRCLTLSDSHLACGFADGAVRLFELSTRNHLRTFHPHPANRLGHFSRAVSGIVFSNNNTTLVFATLDGDIHVAIINGPALADTAHVGSLVDDGTLVDFTGCGRWWVGLHAGAPGRAFHIWDSVTQLPIFVGGSLTDPEAVMGWHMLTEVTEFVGRIRVTSQESAVACTSSRVMVIDLSNPGVVLFDEEARRGLIVTSADVSDDAYISVDGRGRARVRRVDTMEDVCRFNVFGGGGGSGGSRVMGCMNRGYALMCVGGVIRVWEVEHGVVLYTFGERIGEVNALVANETHVAAASSDNTIHLWDFGAGAGAGAGAE